MKIRHKQSGVVLEGQFVAMGEANALGARSYYVPVGTMSRSEYDMREWEEVKPAPTWVDVTGECNLLQGVRLWHGEDVIADLRYGYRIRKIDIRPWGNEQQDAFIIEQRQP